MARLTMCGCGTVEGIATARAFGVTLLKGAFLISLPCEAATIRLLPRLAVALVGPAPDPPSRSESSASDPSSPRTKALMMMYPRAPSTTTGAHQII